MSELTDLIAECGRLENALRKTRAERDEAVKARWRTQDTLARVRDVAEQHSRLGISIGPDALLDGLNEGTDGGH